VVRNSIVDTHSRKKKQGEHGGTGNRSSRKVNELKAGQLSSENSVENNPIKSNKKNPIQDIEKMP
jgi:hypothetical protein